MALAEVQAGMNLTPLDVTYGPEGFREFSMWALSEETGKPSKNIHTDDELARARGLKKSIGFGPQLTAQVYRMVSDNLGRIGIAKGGISLTFIRPFYVGDTVRAGGLVRSVKTVPAPNNGAEVEMEVWCEDQSGTRVAAGSVTARTQPWRR